MALDRPTLLCALGLALVLEAVPYFLLAERMPRYFRTMASMPPRVLRLVAALMLALGLGLVALGRA
ncbi:MAG: DUF2065 domain-containing protein [Desulfomicrobiaceae bacterium]|uniref:DUF2065 domain-containing protein n=1 Tax=Thermodesulfomicrobium sp. WS TaxID=3004129 RepID=UPI002491E7F4|nr:DUF2065 domain-containing protein [Thermodesulfomicrobium sp. WS]